MSAGSSSTMTQTLLDGQFPSEEFMSGVLRLRGSHLTPSTTAFPELDKNGYTVVKGVISREKAAQYVQRMYQWLESFGTGFKANDRSTWHINKVIPFNKGGLFSRYGAGHEQYAWDIRAEPELIKVFAKIWGTEELLVSYDASNISLPYPAEEMEGDVSAPWPHVDQSPNRRFKHCVQGIMNLEENGPNDGGLMVLTGSLPLYNEFFETHEHLQPEGGWSWKDSYPFTEADMQWFYDRGCKWIKVEAEPGDVILWDSRCVHYGAAARGDRPRVATYVCYKPAAEITPEMKEARKIATEQLIGTSHDPLLFRMTGTKILGDAIPNERREPLVRPVLTERMQQLAGVKAY
ncbi:hypothetical protein BD324DRAFT_632306 [Kockovaella imperatae]|uniref:Phytanoyl-CoA dioxygenase n=1 Tax=Kockovaella imperatae TaxID=4999 RepID=A0A1Y1UCR9_9TREE|nr:hypothetical protein BD324DRAFT_632306 [Kockovaella imperatae]ORX35314.1 hypothetical protein BD324DRAFT_632306 [Kockovaella imperatae]